MTELCSAMRQSTEICLKPWSTEHTATVPVISCNNTAATWSSAVMTLQIVSSDSACLSLYSAIFILSGIPQGSRKGLTLRLHYLRLPMPSAASLTS